MHVQVSGSVEEWNFRNGSFWFASPLVSSSNLTLENIACIVIAQVRKSVWIPGEIRFAGTFLDEFSGPNLLKHNNQQESCFPRHFTIFRQIYVPS